MNDDTHHTPDGRPMNGAQALMFDVGLLMVGILFAASLDMTLMQALHAVNITLLVVAAGVAHAFGDDPDDEMGVEW